MYLIMYKTLLLYKYFGNKELKLCVCVSEQCNLRTKVVCMCVILP